MTAVDHETLVAMLDRLKLTAIRDQLDTLLDEAARSDMTLRESLAFLVQREIARRDERNHPAAIIRIEQLYPFPREALSTVLQTYAKATEVVWCQEEPQNQGAWYQIKHHLQACLAKGQALSYAGRTRSPSPAVGHFADHVEEQLKLVADALVNPPGNQLAAE